MSIVRRKRHAATKMRQTQTSSFHHERVRDFPVRKHAVADDVLKKIVARVLLELQLPDKIPSEVIFAALTEVRDKAEQPGRTR